MLEIESLVDKRQRLKVLAEDTRTRMKRSAMDIYHIGANLLEAQGLLAHGEFLPWIEAEFDMSQRSAYKFINVAKAFQGKFAQNANLEICASALYLLASSDTPEQARMEAIELAASGESITNRKAVELRQKHINLIEEDKPCSVLLPNKTNVDFNHLTVLAKTELPEIITDSLEEQEKLNSQTWIETIVLNDGRKLFVKHSNTESSFNRTNAMVDWAWYTWNPVTGCWHKCDYCYARDIANRFFTDVKFEPTFHPYRLAAPVNTPVPPEASIDIRAKNVFVCSMADLFGAWVPEEWIMAVFQQVIANPQWNFLFLTKFPQRLQEICDKLGGFPDNAWVN
mgnify:CR=1 FL=1